MLTEPLRITTIDLRPRSRKEPQTLNEAMNEVNHKKHIYISGRGEKRKMDRVEAEKQNLLCHSQDRWVRVPYDIHERDGKQFVTFDRQYYPSDTVGVHVMFCAEYGESGKCVYARYARTSSGGYRLDARSISAMTRAGYAEVRE